MKTLRKGDKVTWKSSQGIVKGKVVGKKTRPTKIKSHRVAASAANPTRFALTAAAWGEPLPKTVAAARRIAAKGRRLLEKAKRLRGAKK